MISDRKGRAQICGIHDESPLSEYRPSRLTRRMLRCGLPNKARLTKGITAVVDALRRGEGSLLFRPVKFDPLNL